MIDQSKWGAHIEHCCVLHGCKYGDEDCPITLNQIPFGQAYPCEQCEDEGISLREVEEFVLRKRMEKQEGIKIEFVLFRHEEKMDHFNAFHEKWNKFLEDNNYVFMGISETQGETKTYEESFQNTASAFALLESEPESIDVNIISINEDYKKNTLNFEEQDLYHDSHESDDKLKGKELLIEQIKYAVSQMLYNTLDHKDQETVEQNKSIAKDIYGMLKELKIYS